jgi:putative ABC transport system substrate-binding protein
VTSLARPAGNATGFALYDHTVASKWLQLLSEVTPNARHIGVIFDPTNGGDTYASEIEKASPPSIHVQTFSIRSRADIEQAIDRTGGEPDSALLVLSGPLTAQHRDLIVAMAIKYRLPILHPYRYYTASGALMSYGLDVTDQYRRAAEYVDRILRGAKVADLPIQFATSYKLVINLKTARVLGLTVPPTLLARADEVIE